MPEIKKEIEDFVETVLEPKKLRERISTSVSDIISRISPTTFEDIVSKIPLPTEVIPMPHEFVPDAKEIKDFITGVIPTPKTIAEIATETVSPSRKAETVARVVTPGAIVVAGIVGGLIIASAITTAAWIMFAGFGISK